MTTKNLFFILVLFVFGGLQAQKFSHTVSMPEPHTHYFEVTWEIEDWKEGILDAKMPVWAPGSYLVREFSKSVEAFNAENEKGKALDVEKINKNTWRVVTNGEDKIKISYRVYAYELSVRTSFLDADHGYINGTSIFMYADGHLKSGGTVEIKPHKNWKKVSTALPVKEGFVYTYNDYDQLGDCPIEIGNHEVFEFNASGVKHKVAMFGEGNYDIPTLQEDMAKIVDACTDVFGENPNKEYLFIIHNLTVGSGGLEHTNSTTLQVNRWTYEGDDYLGFLSLVAHEYFHLWNVKRLRPAGIRPYNYGEENYTNMLWVMEGFTSYYDEILLHRAGFYSDEEYLNKIFGTMNYVENLPGNHVQSLSCSSHDAWIKAYRPNENSRNTTISYYSKGSLAALLIDAQILAQSKGKLNLDAFMQELYRNHYKKQRKGFTDEDFLKSLSKYMKGAGDFLQAYIYDVQPLPYEKVLESLGIEVVEIITEMPDLGVNLSGNEVRSVTRETPAYEGGINVNDELISINGWRIKNNLSELIDRFADEKVEILLTRDSKMRTLEVQLFPVKRKTYKYVLNDNDLYNAWLMKGK